jgi:toxin ParE1/3/4
VKIRYRPTALAELDAIFARITAQNPAAAQRVIASIKRSIDLLADFPRSARQSEIPGIREMPFIVFYTIDDAAQEVHVLRVRHTSQDPDHHLTNSGYFAITPVLRIGTTAEMGLGRRGRFRGTPLARRVTSR